MTRLVTDDELRTLLVDRLEILDHAEIDKAQALAARLRIPLERALADRGRVPYAFLLEQLAESWNVGFIDLKPRDVKVDALKSVPVHYAQDRRIMPFRRADGELHVAMVDPRDRKVIDEIAQFTKLRVTPHLAPSSAIERAQLLYKGDLREMLVRTAAAETTTATRSSSTDEASAVTMVNQLLEYAFLTGASDIHVEPYEFETLVRLRIDGVLHEVISLAPAALATIVARIKVLSGLRIDERRVPQDGRFEGSVAGNKIDLRVSVLPSYWGEKIVMRVLQKQGHSPDLETLGLSPADYRTVLRDLFRPHGMLLVTGPTGSGKTTTLYAMLSRLSAERQSVVNVSTIEDPIEYAMPRVVQTQVNTATNLDFASALRALLRQDPDVIMVGEIRDRETAEIAVRAALVGRLLLSTLHTNDSTSAIPRLFDMGIEPFLLASTLQLVVAQRLVRRICENCRESCSPTESDLATLRARPDFDATMNALRKQGVVATTGDPLSRMRLFRGRGCQQCAGAGFAGRLGIFELFEITDDIRQMISERRDGPGIRAAALAGGMKTMLHDGLAKVFLGGTTLQEVFRVAI